VATTPLIIAHRGGAGIAPENTIIAIETAKALRVDCIEIDIRMTSDGTLTVFHDRRLNRTTYGKGGIRKYSFQELQQYPIKSKLAGDFNIQRIPSLEQVLAAIMDSNITLMVEVKSPSASPKLTDKLAQLVKSREVVDQVEIFSFDKNFIVSFRERYPEFKTGWLVSGRIPKIRYPKVQFVGLYYKSALLFPKQVTRLQRKGYRVYVWTVNTEKSMRKILKLGVDGIITDYPNILIKVMKSEKPS